MKKLAEVWEDCVLLVDGIDRYPVSIERAELLLVDLRSAIDGAKSNLEKKLKSRKMPDSDRFEARLRVDLRDSYGDLYYSNGSVVTVFRRTAIPGQAESVLKYPFAIGTFWVDAAAFDPL